jgi:hypothetical protein
MRDRLVGVLSFFWRAWRVAKEARIGMDLPGYALQDGVSVEGTNPEEFQKKWQLSLDRSSPPKHNCELCCGII